MKKSKHFSEIRFLLSVLTISLIPTLANATRIGLFLWEDDPFNQAIFTVFNDTNAGFSLGPPGETFFDVNVTINLDDGSSLIINLGDIGAGGATNTTDDFTGLVILSATVDFTFPVAGTVIQPTLFVAGDAVIEFDRTQSSAIPVPNPLMLLALGGILLVFYNRTKTFSRNLVS